MDGVYRPKFRSGERKRLAAVCYRKLQSRVAAVLSALSMPFDHNSRQDRTFYSPIHKNVVIAKYVRMKKVEHVSINNSPYDFAWETASCVSFIGKELNMHERLSNSWVGENIKQTLSIVRFFDVKERENNGIVLLPLKIMFNIS